MKIAEMMEKELHFKDAKPNHSELMMLNRLADLLPEEEREKFKEACGVE